MITRCKDEKGEFVTDIFSKDGKVYDTNMLSEKHEGEELPIPAELLPKDDEYYDLVIEFRSSGYYDSGCISGPPDNWYPPEDDDERVPERVYCIQYIKKEHSIEKKLQNDYGSTFDTKIIELDSKVSEAVFDHFSKQVYQQELKEDVM